MLDSGHHMSGRGNCVGEYPKFRVDREQLLHEPARNNKLEIEGKVFGMLEFECRSQAIQGPEFETSSNMTDLSQFIHCGTKLIYCFYRIARMFDAIPFQFIELQNGRAQNPAGHRPPGMY
jgi:hypothetical protein